MIEVFATILVVIVVVLVVIAVILVVVAVTLVVVASIGVVIVVFAKNKGPEFEIFFSEIQKRYFFPAFSRFLHSYYKLTFQILQIRCFLQISCHRLCKIIFKYEAISVGHPLQGSSCQCCF